MPWLSPADARAMTEDDRLDYLTRTVLGEAVGEGYVGMLVVSQIIANRASDPRFPSDPVAVAGQSWQFSTNNPGVGGNQGMVTRYYGPGTAQYRTARAAVQAAIYDRSIPDITGGSVQYHTVQMGWPASWPTSIQRNGYIDIGNHRVYPAQPVDDAVIRQRLSTISYIDGVGIVSSRTVQPIRPATMSSALQLQRETNRVAQQQANAPAIIRQSRAFAFDSITNPLEAPRPSINNGMIYDRPIPAMRSSLVAEIQARATGTPSTTERVFAFQQAQNQLGDAFVSRPLPRPPAVTSPPWNVFQSVAAQVAAADAAAGRNQLVMTGNPNIPGSVVDWLYPRIAEGQGDANQDGKGRRYLPQSIIERAAPTPTEKRSPVPQSIIERGPAYPPAPGQSIIERGPAYRPAPGQSLIERLTGVQERPAPGQSQIERSRPIVLVGAGGAQVVPQSQIERSYPQDMFARTLLGANMANRPQLAISLASSIAKRNAMQVAADTRMMREANEGRSGTTVASFPTSSRSATMVPSSPIERWYPGLNLLGSIASRPSAITPASQQRAADERLLRSANEGRAGTTVATIPTNVAQPRNPVTVTQERLPANVYPMAPNQGIPMSHYGEMPTFAQVGALRPPRIDAVGTMPSFAALGALRPQIPGQSGIERAGPNALSGGQIQMGVGGPPTTRVVQSVPVPAAAPAAPLPRPRPPTLATVTPPAVAPVAPRPTTVAPPVKDRMGGISKRAGGIFGAMVPGATPVVVRSYDPLTNTFQNRTVYRQPTAPAVGLSPFVQQRPQSTWGRPLQNDTRSVEERLTSGSGGQGASSISSI